MLRNSFIASLLLVKALPACALELEPGLWEQVIESENRVDETLQKTSREQCLTKEEAEDSAATLRRQLSEAEYTDVEVIENANTVNAHGLITREGQDVELSITLIKHSDTHSSSTIEMVSNSSTVTISSPITTIESHWIAEDC